jgi:hypothetical protein
MCGTPVALELRAANPRTKDGPLGEEYSQRLSRFEEGCQFVPHARAELESGAGWQLKVRASARASACLLHPHMPGWGRP